MIQSTLRRYRLAIAVSAMTFLAGLALIPMATLPYQGDDLYNRGWAGLGFSRGAAQSWDISQQWMRGEGRFFPSAGAYHVVTWNVFDDRYSYHAYLVVLVAVLVLTFSLACLLITRHVGAAVTAFGLAVAACQYRYWTVDGITNMGGQITTSALLTIIAGVACGRFVRRPSVLIGLLAVATWSFTITTYEVSLLMLPALLLLALTHARTVPWRSFVLRSAVLTVPALLDLLVVSYLRSRALGPSPAYSTNLHGPVTQTFLRQFEAGLPSSQYVFHGVPEGLHYPLAITVFIFVVIGVPTAAALCWGRIAPATTRGNIHSSLPVIAAGLWAWLVPSALVAINARWQTDLPVGQGYIYTVYASLGVALTAAGLALALSGIPEVRLRHAALTAAVCISLIAASGTAASNMRYANALNPGPVYVTDPNP